jgi:thiol:disulfide interchange protein DsbD
MKSEKQKIKNGLVLALLLAAASVLPGLAIAGNLWHGADAGSSVPDVLPVDEAFQLQPVERSEHGLKLGWLVAKGTYLYRERIRIEAAEPAALKLAKAKMPDGEKHHDEHFGDVHVYRAGRYDVEIPGSNSLAKLKKVKVSYQGCAESGVCYSPQTRIVDVVTLSTAQH